MAGKPPGSEVGLYYDAERRVLIGDEIVTATTGRRYLVLAVRIQMRGEHEGRQHLRCVVLADDHERDPDSGVHTVHWYRR